MRSSLSLAVMALCLFIGTSAAAQDKMSIALIDIEVSGDGPPELRQQLQTHIAVALAEEGFKVTNLDQTLKALQGVPELIGCSSTTCLERIFERIPANRFFRAIVTASGANYEIQLELLSALEDTSVVNTLADSCAVCTISDLNTLIGEAARKLVRPNSGQELRVEIATTPPGATIVVGAVEVGVSPVIVKLKTGSHRVRAKLDGHEETEKPIEVLADLSEKQRFELLLTKSAALRAGVNRPSVDYGNKKWIAVGASLSLFTLGTVLVAIDGNPTCSSSTGTCPEVRDTLTGGIFSMSGGVLLGALGGWMFWRESESAKSRSNLTIHATQGGGMAGYGYSF